MEPALLEHTPQTLASPGGTLGQNRGPDGPEGTDCEVCTWPKAN